MHRKVRYENVPPTIPPLKPVYLEQMAAELEAGVSPPDLVAERRRLLKYSAHTMLRAKAVSDGLLIRSQSCGALQAAVSFRGGPPVLPPNQGAYVCAAVLSIPEIAPTSFARWTVPRAPRLTRVCELGFLGALSDVFTAVSNARHTEESAAVPVWRLPEQVRQRVVPLCPPLLRADEAPLAGGEKKAARPGRSAANGRAYGGLVPWGAAAGAPAALCASDSGAVLPGQNLLPDELWVLAAATAAYAGARGLFCVAPAVPWTVCAALGAPIRRVQLTPPPLLPPKTSSGTSSMIPGIGTGPAKPLASAAAAPADADPEAATPPMGTAEPRQAGDDLLSTDDESLSVVDASDVSAPSCESGLLAATSPTSSAAGSDACSAADETRPASAGGSRSRGHRRRRRGTHSRSRSSGASTPIHVVAKPENLTPIMRSPHAQLHSPQGADGANDMPALLPLTLQMRLATALGLPVAVPGYGFHAIAHRALYVPHTQLALFGRWLSSTPGGMDLDCLSALDCAFAPRLIGLVRPRSVAVRVSPRIDVVLGPGLGARVASALSRTSCIERVTIDPRIAAALVTDWEHEADDLDQLPEEVRLCAVPCTGRAIPTADMMPGAAPRPTAGNAVVELAPAVDFSDEEEGVLIDIGLTDGLKLANDAVGAATSESSDSSLSYISSDEQPPPPPPLAWFADLQALDLATLSIYADADAAGADCVLGLARILAPRLRALALPATPRLGRFRAGIGAVVAGASRLRALCVPMANSSQAKHLRWSLRSLVRSVPNLRSIWLDWEARPCVLANRNGASVPVTVRPPCSGSFDSLVAAVARTWPDLDVMYASAVGPRAMSRLLSGGAQEPEMGLSCCSARGGQGSGLNLLVLHRADARALLPLSPASATQICIVAPEVLHNMGDGMPYRAPASGTAREELALLRQSKPDSADLAELLGHGQVVRPVPGLPLFMAMV